MYVYVYFIHNKSTISKHTATMIAFCCAINICRNTSAATIWTSAPMSMGMYHISLAYIKKQILS